MTKAWAERLPKSVRVGPHIWRVELWTHLQGSASGKYGECSTQEFRISVQAEVHALSSLFDTVIHELSHAIYWAQDIADDDKEERSVTRYATGWTQVFRDNPELVRWLYDASAEMRERQ